MTTLREQILAAADLPREKVQTDEWAPFGVPFVFVQGLSAKERDEWELSLTVRSSGGGRVLNPQMKQYRAPFCARVIVDENGKRIFSDDDVKELAGKSAVVLDRIFDEGRRLSGMTIEEDVNPSTGDQEDSSSSDSPTPSDSQTSTA